MLGRGFAPALLELCTDSICNSIDASALRVPPEVSDRVDLVLTGAQWQSVAVLAGHPAMATAILPIGPEFAAIDQFLPLGSRKDFDRSRSPPRSPISATTLRSTHWRCSRRAGAVRVRRWRDGNELRRRAADVALDSEFVGPPGVPIDEIGRPMDRVRLGVGCGVDDGAPAILTDYMRAGPPVPANAELCCGRQFILPERGSPPTPKSSPMRSSRCAPPPASIVRAGTVPALDLTAQRPTAGRHYRKSS